MDFSLIAVWNSIGEYSMFTASALTSIIITLSHSHFKKTDPSEKSFLGASFDDGKGKEGVILDPVQ